MFRKFSRAAQHSCLEAVECETEKTRFNAKLYKKKHIYLQKSYSKLLMILD